MNSLSEISTINTWLKQATETLGNAEIASAQLDAELILSDTLQKSREWLLAHDSEHIEQNSLEIARQRFNRRLHREPLAYILGRVWFYGRTFSVTPDVLIPRPESEDFIDILKEIKPKLVLDVGTGSGCLAISTKLELPNCQVAATDISKDALRIARKNSGRHGVNIAFLHGSLFGPIKEYGGEVVIANLPYVPRNLVTSPEIETEPPQALFAGHDGLDVYRKFWIQAKNLTIKPRYIIVESLESQHQEMRTKAKIAGYSLQKTKGIIQVFKS